MRMAMALVAVVGLSASARGFALPDTATPATCAREANAQSAYRDGEQIGRSLVQRAWLRIRDCSQLDRFTETTRANIGRYKNRAVTSYVICRYAGMVNGANEQLLRIQTACR